MSGKVLKHKRHYSPRRFPETGRPVAKAAPPRVAEGPQAVPEPSKMVFVGAIEKTDRDEAIAFDIPAGASVEGVRRAIEAANQERAEKLAQESAELRRVFLER